MPLLIREREVSRFLPMRDAIAAVEAALREHAEGRAFCVPRTRARLPSGLLHTLSASLPSQDACGLKAYTSTPSGARFVMLLFSASEGTLQAILEAERLGQIRTGAATGVASRLLARGDAKVLALLGSGFQAEAQLEACSLMRNLSEVRVWSRRPESAKQFCERMSARLGLSINAALTSEEACRGADLIVTATSSREPLLEGAWLDPGVHINAVGSNHARRRELDAEAVRKCDLVSTDLLEQARLESGDLLEAEKEGAFEWQNASELGSILVGRSPGRTSDEQRTLFKSNGIALEDVAVAALVYRRALDGRAGEHIDMSKV
ncbi:MAG: ornithine cyclodeaminase family protein [Acidobacteria bacterium]|nr:ornithine cyclodeaminase family protein [Acidobacteriota bacterium]